MKRLAAFLLFTLSVKSVDAAWGFVQAIGLGAAASDTTIAVAQASNPTATNLIVVFVNGTAAANTSPTVADTLKNTYAEIPAAKTVFGTYTLSTVFYAYNVTGGAANTVTATYAGATTMRMITVAEYSGLRTASTPLDSAIGQIQAAPGTGTDILTSTALTVAEAGEVLVGYTVDLAGSFASIAASSGFTERLNGHPGYVLQVVVEDKTPSTGSNAATFTLNDNGTDTFATQAVAFKLPATGGAVRRRVIIIGP